MGGGVFNNLPSTALIANCIFNGNPSGDATGSSGANGFGGGIRNDGAMTVMSSTISANISHGPGGGIFNRPSAAITVINSMVSGNSAASGGGIHNDGGALFLTNCTITNNSAAGSDGVITFASGNPTIVKNTIIAGNGAGPDLSGTFTSQG